MSLPWWEASAGLIGLAITYSLRLTDTLNQADCVHSRGQLFVTFQSNDGQGTRWKAVSNRTQCE